MTTETKLPERFTSDGFELAQVFREGDLAIYTQSKFGRVIAYEAVRIRHRPARKLPNGVIIPPQEAYPHPSDWGFSAWSCATLERAHQKLAALRERRGIATNKAREGKDSHTPSIPECPTKTT
jgi:hypothetical protein